MLNANSWHFNIYEQDKFHAQLSWAWKKIYNLEAMLGTSSAQPFLISIQG